MDDRDRDIEELLNRASTGWSFDARRSRTVVEERTRPTARRGPRWTALTIGLLVGVAAVGSVIVLALASDSPGDNVPAGAMSPSASATESTCQGAIDLRPTYLPWLEGEITQPHETYDASIDREQLSWMGPGGTGVGLTLYPHAPQGNWGEETDILIDGVAGRLHREDEGDLVSMSWDLSGRRCNFLELIVSLPGGTKKQAIDELMRIAKSLRPAA
jgi:hypothetical protein